jgi:hypothetical protein
MKPMGVFYNKNVITGIISLTLHSHGYIYANGAVPDGINA